MTRAHLYCESYKTMNTTNIKECYCVAKKKLIRGEKTKPQTAMVITLWFWGFRSCMCTEQYGDWSLHNQRFSGINDFLSLTAKLLKTFSLRYWWFTRSVLYKVAIHGSPWRCTRLSLLLDKPCNICFLPWAGKMINIGLFRRKSFGCLTRVVHKS